VNSLDEEGVLNNGRTKRSVGSRTIFSWDKGWITNRWFTTNTAKWGAELSATLAEEPAQEYIYIIEPIGAFENDPNVTDKKFPGNPTRSYRSKEPLRIVAKLATWERHSNHDIEQMLKGLAQLRKDGLDIIED